MVQLIYHYHPVHFTYMGSSPADESPLEPGVYLIPAYATMVTPPEPTTIPTDHDIKWNSQQNNWTIESRPLPVITEEPEPTPPLDAMTQLRQERNRFLKESDWVAIKYYTQGVPFPVEWADYFQALRDLPINSSPSLNPDGTLDMNSVNWPIKPTDLL